MAIIVEAKSRKNFQHYDTNPIKSRNFFSRVTFVIYGILQRKYPKLRYSYIAMASDFNTFAYSEYNN